MFPFRFGRLYHKEMTHRIFSFVSIALVLFFSSLSFAQDPSASDDFNLDSAAAEVPPTQAPSALPPDSTDLNLDNPLDAMTNTPAQEPEVALDDFANPENNLMAATQQNIDDAENVNLASPIELRQKNAALFGFSVGLLLSSQPFEEKYDVTSVVQGNDLSSTRVNKQTDTVYSYGVMLRYAVTPYYSLGTDLNVSYSKSQNHSSITVKNTSALSEITTLKGELNFSYAVDAGKLPIYFLAGIGTEKITGTEIEKIINPIGFGGQAGAGFVINSTINLEAMYSYYEHRLSNKIVEGYASGTPTGKIDTERARVINQGLVLRGSFSFNL